MTSVAAWSPDAGGGGDSAYSGQRDVIRQHAPKAKSFVQVNAHLRLDQSPLSGAGKEHALVQISCGLANRYVARRRLLVGVERMGGERGSERLDTGPPQEPYSRANELSAK